MAVFVNFTSRSRSNDLTIKVILTWVGNRANKRIKLGLETLWKFRFNLLQFCIENLRLDQTFYLHIHTRFPITQIITYNQTVAADNLFNLRKVIFQRKEQGEEWLVHIFKGITTCMSVSTRHSLLTATWIPLIWYWFVCLFTTLSLRTLHHLETRHDSFLRMKYVYREGVKWFGQKNSCHHHLIVKEFFLRSRINEEVQQGAFIISLKPFVSRLTCVYLKTMFVSSIHNNRNNKSKKFGDMMILSV